MEVSAIKNKNSTAEGESVFNKIKIPVKNEEELAKFEEDLKEISNSMSKEMAIIGEVLVKFSFLGQKRKRKFKELQLYEVLIESIRQCPSLGNPSLKEIELNVQNYLKSQERITISEIFAVQAAGTATARADRDLTLAGALASTQTCCLPPPARPRVNTGTAASEASLVLTGQTVVVGDKGLAQAQDALTATSSGVMPESRGAPWPARRNR
ncbi:hypothetical protein FQR65_LT16864 [Abscondita terminalis]|nr:hypothetical protein FQR65_LT16864 [Abscondita terminalis]